MLTGQASNSTVVFPNNIIVANYGTGTATIGTTVFDPGVTASYFSGNLTLNRATTLQAGNADRTLFTGSISGNVGTLTIALASGASTASRIDMGGANSFVGDVQIASGNLELEGTSDVIPNDSSLDVASGASLLMARNNGGSSGAESIDALTGAGKVQVQVQVATVQTLTIGAGNGSGAFSGSIINGGAPSTLSIIKAGTGTEIFAGTSSYTGTTSIQGGTLQFAKTTAMSSSSATSVSSGAMLAINVGGTGEFTNGTTGTGTIGGVVSGVTYTAGSLLGIDTTNATGGSLTYGGIIGTSLGLVKLGSGTLTLSGVNPNTYTGGTTVNAGTLQLSGAASFGASANTLTINGGAADLNTNSTTANRNVGALNGSGGTVVNNNTSSLAGSLTVGNGNATGSYGGTIANNSGGTANGTVAIIKTGTGTETLTGANTYSGNTTVNAGSFLINNTSGSGTGTGNVAVNNSGTLLGGNGAISGAVTVASGAKLAPGATTTAGSTAIFQTGALTMQSGSSLNIDVTSSTIAGSGYDQAAVSGALTLTGSNLVINPGSGLVPGEKFFIALNDGTDLPVGTFAQGATVTVGMDVFAINYADNGDLGAVANDISLTVTSVPEPATLTGACLMVGMILCRHWRELGVLLRRRFRGA